jgi:hypothetical protein
MTTEELRNLYLNTPDENLEHAMKLISRYVPREYILLDEDGFSFYVYYGPDHIMIHYQNRKTGNELIDFLGVLDWELELMVFLGRLMQLFGHELWNYESQMIAELEDLLKNRMSQ